MMKLNILMCLFLSLMLTGCATTNYEANIQHLQMQVVRMQQTIEQRDEEVEALRYEVRELATEVRKQNRIQETRIIETPGRSDGITRVESNGIIRITVSPEDVQGALKSAGYYSGNIDGKIGNNTKKAIASFQKDHDLKADGIIGLKTWDELKSYIE